VRVRDTIALRCEPLRRESSGASALKRRERLAEAVDETVEERGVVNERNACSQSATKAASMLANGSRSCSKSARTLPPSIGSRRRGADRAARPA
jgi:hypothetical protein